MKSPEKLVMSMCYILSHLCILSVTAVYANNPYDEPVVHPAIPLLDENGVHVLQSQQAYSPKKSCEGSGCHDYEKITHAYHFEFGRDEADDAYGLKRGIPQLVSPGYFGGYSCMGGSNPGILAAKNNASAANFADYGASGFIKDCYTCHVGGGSGEKDRNGIRYTDMSAENVAALDGDYFNRGTDENNGRAATETVAPWNWKKSGVMEADCMICHTEFDKMIKFPASQLGPSEGEDAKSALDDFKDGRRAMAKGGNFRFISNSIWEFIPNAEGKNFLTFERQPAAPAEDGGGHGGHKAAAKAGEAGAPVPMELAFDEATGEPKIKWHADAFDENGRMTVKMLRFPDNENCMMCHITSNSRRGFYGFGADAVMELGEDGILETDLKDDVHKGKVYKEANGEERVIDNCNACHSSMYFKPSFSNVDLDAHHNFLKGDSDMDIRNDLDYAPGAKDCEHCHLSGPNLIIPSGQTTLLGAHREIWKANGDMTGYDKDSLSKITQTHFDVVGCETCHITKLENRGKPLIPMYRYRNAQDGKLKIVPSNPRMRYYWKDKVSGRALVKFERNSAFKAVTPEDGSDPYGLIVDPETGEEFGRVTARVSHGSLRFGEPESYEAFVGLKKVYDKILQKKGYANADTAMVWTESNQYIITHNVRPSPESMPCADCHTRKQNGSFSSLVSAQGVLGEGNVKEVVQLPDRRLVDEGIVILDMPYMKVDDAGRVTENVGDILYASKLDPSMTILKNSKARVVTGQFKTIKSADLISIASNIGLPLQQEFPSSDSFLYTTLKGMDSVRKNMALAIDGGGINDLTFPTYRTEIGIIPGEGVEAAKTILAQTGLGSLSSDVFFIDISDKNKGRVAQVGDRPLVVMLPYRGQANSLDQVNVAFADWSLGGVRPINPSDLLAIQPADDTESGFVVFKTYETGYFVIANK